MATRFFVKTDAAITNAGFMHTGFVQIDRTAYAASTNFGLQLRSPGSGGGSSFNVGYFQAQLDASDNAILALDANGVDNTKNVTIRLFRGTDTSGTRRFGIYKGDNTNTETFGINAATGGCNSRHLERYRYCGC